MDYGLFHELFFLFLCLVYWTLIFKSDNYNHNYNTVIDAVAKYDGNKF